MVQFTLEGSLEEEPPSGEDADVTSVLSISDYSNGKETTEKQHAAPSYSVQLSYEVAGALLSGLCFVPSPLVASGYDTVEVDEEGYLAPTPVFRSEEDFVGDGTLSSQEVPEAERSITDMATFTALWFLDEDLGDVDSLMRATKAGLDDEEVFVIPDWFVALREKEGMKSEIKVLLGQQAARKTEQYAPNPYQK